MLDVRSDARARLQTEEEKAVKVGFARLLRMVAPDWAYIVVGVLASAVLGTVMPVFALILGARSASRCPCTCLATPSRNVEGHVHGVPIVSHDVTSSASGTVIS